MLSRRRVFQLMKIAGLTELDKLRASKRVHANW